MIVGLVGGIGAGKSTVRRLCEELGAETVDADALAHEALETPAVRTALREIFGPEAIRSTGGSNEMVDRKVVGSLAFSDPSKLKRLEALVHPYVLKKIEERVQSLMKRAQNPTERNGIGRNTNVLVLDVPLLIETPLAALCDEIVYVHATREARARRVAERGWAEGELERREALQAPDAEKRRNATVVVDNSRSLDDTRRQVKDLYRIWTKSS